MKFHIASCIHRIVWEGFPGFAESRNDVRTRRLRMLAPCPLRANEGKSPGALEGFPQTKGAIERLPLPLQDYGRACYRLRRRWRACDGTRYRRSFTRHA